MNTFSDNYKKTADWPKREIILLKAKEFWMKAIDKPSRYQLRRQTIWQLLPIAKRRVTVYVLHTRFAFTPKQIGDFVGMDRATIIRDVDAAEFDIRRYLYWQNLADRIYNYIIYNAKTPTLF